MGPQCVLSVDMYLICDVNIKDYWVKGRGGGTVVSMLTFCSNNLSSNPAQVDDCKKFLEKSDN